MTRVRSFSKPWTLLVAIILVITTVGLAAPASAQQQVVEPLYRLYKGAPSYDHFYTASAAEKDNAVKKYGYRYEGITGDVLSSPDSALVPLYRLYRAAIYDHFYTTSATEKNNAVKKYGYRYEGIAGYVYPASSKSGTPLYRLYIGGSHSDHFYTASAAERDSAVRGGYKYEGVAARLW
ncbi:hypothetical protein GCM10022254_26620 [Actinomadura meridiana]|uniref:DUF5648 domain-containing protein n=1 Tax=Actinomadura meridiana TaxID=559626 RepID=A0ABP8BZ71_9ACTN